MGFRVMGLNKNSSRLSLIGSRLLSVAAGLTMVFWVMGVAADPVAEAIDSGARQVDKASRSQSRVAGLSNDVRAMLNEYKQNIREAAVLKNYNDHLSVMVDSQKAELESLEKQAQEIEITQREVVPLMLRMLKNLEEFISFDLPFLPQERKQRVERLKELVDRADVTTAEKFRQVLEAYQLENEYGRTIEAYRADLDIDEVKQPVDFLRLGRVALFYQTLDGSRAGVWNAETGQWDDLSGKYLKPVRDGLRIARKEAAPDLLVLPVPSPEEVK